MAVDSSGNVFVTGYSRGSGGDDDYATIAYSSAGVALWTNRYNGPGNGDDEATAAAGSMSQGTHEAAPAASPPILPPSFTRPPVRR